MQHQARSAEERCREEDEDARAEETGRRARPDDPHEGALDLQLVDRELLGELADDLARRLLAGEDEADDRDAEQQDRDQRDEEEEREPGAEEEAVGREKARDRAATPAHNCRKK